MTHAHTDRIRALLLTASVLLLTGCGAPATPEDAPPPVSRPPAHEVPVDSMDSAQVPMSIPNRLSIDDLGIDSEIRTMPAGACPILDPPDLDHAFWVGCRSMPGTDSDGTVFVIGHAAAGKDAVFDRLPEISAGSTVRIETDAGTVEYVVQETALYEKVGEAQSSPELRRKLPGRLVLVTCYLENGTTLSSKNFVAYASISGAVAR
ncbi:hypothetical protein ABH922_002870 [Rhodococcus sp. 27YEA15]|uniref:class F sortase n=1 Tax=Rhodococcus sp. 27YEA15 TaxID=3156259 RepID=UPI003C7E4984